MFEYTLTIVTPLLSCPEDSLDILVFLLPGHVGEEVRKRTKIYNSIYLPESARKGYVTIIKKKVSTTG